MPEDEDSETESQEPFIEPPIKDLEQWLDHQADQLGTPTWWGELQAVPSIMDLCRFTWKIRASFHILEIWFRASPYHCYSAPPAPKCLNRGAFLPETLEYQDKHRIPKLPTEVYCQCLQHWAEKVSLPSQSGILTFGGECKRTVPGHRRICDHHQTRYNGGSRNG